MKTLQVGEGGGDEYEKAIDHARQTLSLAESQISM